MEAKVKEAVLDYIKSGKDHNLEYIFKTLEPYINKVSNQMNIKGFDFDDLQQECHISIWSNCKKYDPSKGSAIAFLKLCIYKDLIDLDVSSKYLKNLINNQTVSIETKVGSDEFGRDITLKDVLMDSKENNELEDSEQYEKLLKFASAGLTELEAMVLSVHTSRNSYDDTAEIISKQTGKKYTRKNVDNLIQSITRKLS